MKEILKKHKLWLKSGGKEGERANLRDTYLWGANLRGADLRGADLRSADLKYSDLRGANTYAADLTDADLTDAIMPETKAVKHDEGKPAFHLIDPKFADTVSNLHHLKFTLQSVVSDLSMWWKGDEVQLSRLFIEVASVINADAPWLTGQLELARALRHGADKYDEYNWRKGFAWSRPYRAAQSHIAAHRRGDIYDDESGLLHLSHALSCIMFLTVHERDNLGTDDRPCNA